MAGGVRVKRGAVEGRRKSREMRGGGRGGGREVVPQKEGERINSSTRGMREDMLKLRKEMPKLREEMPKMSSLPKGNKTPSGLGSGY